MNVIASQDRAGYRLERIKNKNSVGTMEQMQQKCSSSGVWNDTVQKVTWNERFTTKNNSRYDNNNNNSNQIIIIIS